MKTNTKSKGSGRKIKRAYRLHRVRHLHIWTFYPTKSGTEYLPYGWKKCSKCGRIRPVRDIPTAKAAQQARLQHWVRAKML